MRKPTIIPGVDKKLLIKDAAKLMPDPTRRWFLRGASLGALTMLTGCNIVDSDAAEGVLRKISEFNDWAQARVNAAYWMRRNLSLGLTYIYDQFDVNDWGLGTQTLDRLAQSNTFLLTGYGWEPYTAHTVVLKATYLW